MTPATLNRLAIAAQVWLGTPFFPHGKTPGPDGGCSCQTLAAAVYIEAGVLPEGFEIPIGPIETGFEPMRDALNTWLAKYFAPVESRQAEAGDLMLFKIGRQGHMGISLGNRFIHCLRPAGVKMSRSDDATFLKRLVGVWRPMEGGRIQINPTDAHPLTELPCRFSEKTFKECKDRFDNMSANSFPLIPKT